jgi:PIN domain nuclease of toxin-antitoxin system
MNILIDTHIFLWALSAPSKINVQKRAELETLSNTVYVSSITIAEMMIKASIGKLKIDFDPVDLAKQSGFELLDFSGRDALLLQAMPFHHKDPFDRMLIAQSITNKCHIMTDDKKFSLYECRML